jgi:subtilase family serine protease
MNSRKLILLTVTLLVVCQLGWAQYGPTTAAQMKNLALSAALTPRGLPVVPAAAPGHFRPHIWMGAAVSGQKAVTPALPSFCNVNNSAGGFNWCPNALTIAYGTSNILAANGGAGMTIAIVDAFHYAGANADLSAFSTEMTTTGYTLPQCTLANGCFRQLDQNGGTNYCGSNSGWELETMLDLEWAHAMAPNAKILLVEGCTNSFNDLNTAVLTAVRLGADVVSNSYGSDEGTGESVFDPVYFQQVPIMFSSGDNGAAGKGYPCASINSTCVGGTRLMPVSTTDFHRATETGWSGSGGGCALPEEPLPTWQSGNGVNVCTTRSMPDISADADPATGVIVLDSGNGGHFRVGGTSVSCPLMAGIFADLDTARTTVLPTFLRKPKLAGSASANNVNIGLYLKYAGHNTGNPYALYYFDVLTGNNGLPAGPGYDLVTGLGVLNAPFAGPPWNLP